MKIFLIISMLFLSSCANVAVSRLTYETPDGNKIVLEIPKEIEAKNLKVTFNAQQGTAEITSSSWISKNQGTINAQASREAQILENGAVLIEKASEGAVRGALKGAIP